MPRGAIPFPFGHCRVCNAQATGNHYGANTCEGCKGFFKRSLGKSEKYKCLHNEKCAIDPENRIKCKLCRFKRCLELGMSMDAIKMGRIPKVQKQKALANEKTGQWKAGSVPNADSYRNNNVIQSSPPPSTDDIIEPPTCKQMKTDERKMNPTPLLPPVASPNALQGNGRVQQMIYDGYHGHVYEDRYESLSKQASYNSSEMQQDAQDMVQLLNDVISIDDQHGELDRHAAMSEKMSVTNDYARTLASAANYRNCLNYTNWHTASHNGHRHLAKHESHHHMPKHDSHHQYSQKNGYRGQGHMYIHSAPPYELSPTGHQYNDRHVDMYKIQSRPSAKSGHSPQESSTSPHSNHSTASSHSGVHPQHSAHPHAMTPTSPASGISNGESAYIHGRHSSIENDMYNSMATSISQPAYVAQDGMVQSYAGMPKEKLATVAYEYNNPQPQFSPIHTLEVRSDYGSIDELRPGYHSVGAITPLTTEEDFDMLIKSTAKMYWEVTGETRDGVNIMEDMISTGSTERLLPFSPENLETLWKWLMESVTYYNEMMMKFCLKCPLISSICPEDKSVLIKHSYLSIWLIWSAALFKNGETYIPFRNKYVYNREWMEKILPADFVSDLHEYAQRQNLARFSINETALLCGLALTPPDVKGVKYPEVVSQIRHEFNKALTHEICKNRVNPKEMLKEVPQLLKNLETAVAKQEIILGFNEQSPPEVQF